MPPESAWSPEVKDHMTTFTHAETRLFKHHWFARTSIDMSLFIICLGFDSAVGCERTGYTFILGAFLVGAFLPFNTAIRTTFTRQVRCITTQASCLPPVSTSIR